MREDFNWGVKGGRVGFFFLESNWMDEWVVVAEVWLIEEASSSHFSRNYDPK